MFNHTHRLILRRSQQTSQMLSRAVLQGKVCYAYTNESGCEHGLSYTLQVLKAAELPEGDREFVYALWETNMRDL